MNKECRGPTSLVIVAQMPQGHVGLEADRASSIALWTPFPFELAHPSSEGCGFLVGKRALEAEARLKGIVQEQAIQQESGLRAGVPT